MTKWFEYTSAVIEKSSPVSLFTTEINKLGRWGWELVQLAPLEGHVLAVFKRERDEATQIDETPAAFDAAIGAIRDDTWQDSPTGVYTGPSGRAERSEL